MGKISRICFLVSTILVGFISALLIIFMVFAQKPQMWIDFPNTKINGVNSENENGYISSFFGSEFSNYSLYQSREYLALEKLNKQQKPINVNEQLKQAKFLGDLKNITNVVNDTTTLNLWRKDVDHTQFVVYTKDQQIDKISLNLEINQKQQENLSVSYGWSSYIYSRGLRLPALGVWTPDAITQESTLLNPNKNTVYIAWISVRTLGKQIQPNVELQLTTTIETTEKLVWSQKNKIKLNFIDKDYSKIAENSNEIAFLNNDQMLANYYVQRDQPEDLPKNLNDEVEYVNYVWKKYLKPTYQELKNNNYFNYYSTFFTNTHGKYGIQNTTWKFNQNNPSLINWHRRPSQKAKGEYEIYVKPNEEKAFLTNLQYVAKLGIKNIFLRGFDGIKWYAEKDSNGHYNSKDLNYIFDDETGKLQPLELALVNRKDLKDQYGWTSFDYIQTMINWLTEKIEQNQQEFANLNFYLYFDEAIQEEMDEFMQRFEELKNKHPQKYDFFKIAYVNLYRELNNTDPFLDKMELLYINNFNFNNLDSSKIFNNLIDHREQLGLKTSQYTLSSSYLTKPGYDYSNHVFWMNYTGYIRNPGTLSYLINSWSPDASWTDLFENEDSGGFYLYPSLNPQKYVTKSVKFEMMVFGYNMYSKYQTLLTELGTQKITDYFKNYQYLKVNDFDHKFSKGLRYVFTPISAGKTHNLTKSYFLNWLISFFSDQKVGITEKVIINYQMLNTFEED